MSNLTSWFGSPAAKDFHWHRCSVCGHLWSHVREEILSRCDEAHTCQVCGRQQFIRYYPSPEQVAAAEKVAEANQVPQV
jgi:predicted  nucleic acid-binding Zn-ribbon protein